MEKLRKKHAKTRNEGLFSNFILGKYIFRVCFESPFFYNDDIHPQIQVSPPPPPGVCAMDLWLQLLCGVTLTFSEIIKLQQGFHQFCCV